MQYSINDLSNISEFDIQSINHDSLLPINQLGGINTVLEQDHIVWFRHIRHHDTFLQYKGNLDNNALASVVRKYQHEIVSYNNTSCLEKILTHENILSGYQSLTYNKSYSSFQDIFVFDINKQYYDNLSFKTNLELHDRLQKFIDLIYLNTTFTLKINLRESLAKKPKLNRIYDHEKYAFIKDKFKLSDNELYYLNIISISGSSKEVAKATGKSPRTIEKMIANLCKKLNIQNKFSLQIMAKILASNAGITKSNPHKFELKHVELEV
ncbi:LuxR C-terminal-related transcriptional regulator [Francisellaceae bacterium]|nr:LuxR C-terminal-related transcriptional regulator [Francisellaceae bacterium]